MLRGLTVQHLFLDASLIVLSDAGDHSAACTITEAEVDERMQWYIDMVDPDTIVDLHHHNRGAASRYELIWDECGSFFMRTLMLQLMNDAIVTSHILYVLFLFVIFIIKWKLGYHRKSPFPLLNGFACSFGQKLQDLGLRYSTRIVSGYVLWYNRGSSSALILMSIM